MKVASGRSKPSCLLGFLHFSSINSASGMRDAPFSLDGNNVQTRDPRVPQSRPNGIVLPILSSFKVRSGQTWTFQASGNLNHARTVARTTFQWLTKAYLKQNPSPCSCRNILGPLYLLTEVIGSIPFRSSYSLYLCCGACYRRLGVLEEQSSAHNTWGYPLVIPIFAP